MVYKLHEEVIIRWHGFQPSRNNKVIANIIFLILNKHTPLYIVCPQTQTMGIAFGPRCPLYLFFLKKDAAFIANADMPAGQACYR